MNRDDSSTHCFPRRFKRSAFTLNELLIVIGLMILAMSLALPAFNAISGARSVEASENQVSAYLAAARADAIGVQEPRGVIFFEEPGGGRTVMAQIHYPKTPTQPYPVLDLYPGRDEMILPQGIGFRGVPNLKADVDDYTRWPDYCIILFDGNGQLLIDTAYIPTTSNLAKRLAAGGGTTKVPLPLGTANGAAAGAVRSNIGFILFDAPAFGEQPAANQNGWLKDNANPYLLNRYNGTLLKGV